METGPDHVNRKLIENCCKSDADVCALLEVLFSLDGLIKNIENKRKLCTSRNLFSCFGYQIKKIIESYKKLSDFDISDLSMILKSRLSENVEKLKSQVLLDYALNSIHCCPCFPDTKRMPEMDSGSSCRTCSCPSHSICNLEVQESLKCECGKEENFLWDSNNFFIYFNFDHFFRCLDEKGLFADPRLSDRNLLKTAENRLSFSGTMVNYLKAVIKKAAEKSCSDTFCSWRSSKVSFSLKNNPEVLFIAFKHFGDFDKLSCFVSISSVNQQFDLGELFEDCDQIYGIYGILLENKKGLILYLHQSTRGWVMGGKEISWNEIVQKTVKNQLKTSLVIYKKSRTYEIVSGLSNATIEKHPKMNKKEPIKHSPIEKNTENPYISDHLSKIGYTEANTESFSSFLPQKVENIRPSDSNELSGSSSCEDSEEIKIDEDKHSKVQSFVSKKNDYNPFLRKQKENHARTDSPSLVRLEKSFENKLETEKIEFKTPEEQKEWTCACSTTNSSSFEVCINCKKMKPGLKGWVCDFCTFRNHQSDEKCKSCFKLMMDANFQFPHQNHQPWVCFGCLSWNNPERCFCSKCQLMRPDDD